MVAVNIEATRTRQVPGGFTNNETVVPPQDTMPQATVSTADAAVEPTAPGIAELTVIIADHVYNIRALASARQRAENRYGDPAKRSRAALEVLLPEYLQVTGSAAWKDKKGSASIRSGTRSVKVNQDAHDSVMLDLGDVADDMSTLTAEMSSLLAQANAHGLTEETRFALSVRIGYLMGHVDRIQGGIAKARAAITETVGKPSVVVK